MPYIKIFLVVFYLVIRKACPQLIEGVLVKFSNDSSDDNLYLLQRSPKIISNLTYYSKLNTSDFSYLNFSGIVRRIPNCHTAKRIGFDCRFKVILPNYTLENFEKSASLPSLMPINTNPDEFMRVELDLINTIQNPLVVKVDFLGEFVWHPSMITFRNRTFLSARGKEPLFFEIPHFHWVDITLNNISFSPSIKIDTMGFNFVGREQVRLVLVREDLIHMSFCVPSGKQYAGMQTAALRYNQTREMFELTKPVWMFKAGDDKRIVQKNWVPFLYNSSIHFVYSIHPMVVIKLDPNVYNPDYAPDTYFLETVSEEKCASDYSFPWKYGHMRGGSPAHIVNGEYLAFFHSKSTPLFVGELGGWSLQSYWFGAYTFTAEPPFTITKISRMPIIRNEWYDGAWFNKANGYIVYPAGFVIEVFDNVSYVFLSMSLQDRNGYIAKIPLQALYDSMVPVNCSVKSNESEAATSLHRRHRHRRV